MIRYALALVVLMPVAAIAQPPSGPAMKLYIHNTTDVPATFDVLRHERGMAILTSFVLQPGQDIDLPLVQIKGDRVLIAGGETSQPWTVYGMAVFNAADYPFPTIGYEFKEEAGAIKLKELLQGVTGNKALPEKAKGKTMNEKERNK